MNLPSTSRAAVMTSVGGDLELREYPMPTPTGNEALVRVRCCTICRSDLHTWRGHRAGPLPAILGHEIVGDIVSLGSQLTHDVANHKLAVGDRVTWTLHSCCGSCYYCSELHLPMKCLKLRKYGHDSCDEPPHLQGGFAEYCLIDAGTSVLKLPDNIPYTCAAPLNCAAATVAAGWDAAQLRPSENVLIQGAGGLGCYAAAFAKMSGANRIIVIDLNAERLDMAIRFGATDTIDCSQLSSSETIERVRQLTGGFGADCALELAGVPSIVPTGMAALRKGGRYIEIGCSFPQAHVTIDMSVILWNLLTVRGVHNYDVKHLRRAVQLVSQSMELFPYQQFVSRAYTLEQINDALRFAEVNPVGRVAIEFPD